MPESDLFPDRADAIGVSEQVLSNWLNLHKAPSLKPQVLG